MRLVKSLLNILQGAVPHWRSAGPDAWFSLSCCSFLCGLKVLDLQFGVQPCFSSAHTESAPHPLHDTSSINESEASRVCALICIPEKSGTLTFAANAEQRYLLGLNDPRVPACCHESQLLGGRLQQCLAWSCWDLQNGWVRMVLVRPQRREGTEMP